MKIILAVTLIIAGGSISTQLVRFRKLFPNLLRQRHWPLSPRLPCNPKPIQPPNCPCGPSCASSRAKAGAARQA